jgi:hypothetical protein
MMLQVLPEPYAIDFEKQNCYTFATCYFIEFCQIVVTLVRCFSYPLDQDHAHSTHIAKFLHQESACSIHLPNKYYMCYVISLQVSLKKQYIKNKDMVTPKKKKGMLRSMTLKKREE